MTSQSPATADDEVSDDYKNAWASLMMLVRNEGLSWSGRERNRIFLSMAAKKFADVSATTATDFPEDGRSIAKCDWNNDGAVDLILRNRNAPRLRVLQNNLLHNNWLQVRLVGNATTVSRDAIGTKVVATIGDTQYVQHLTAGDGYLNQSSKTLYFGLASASLIDNLELSWPDGSKMSFDNVAVNQLMTVTQGKGIKSSGSNSLKLTSAPWQGVSEKDVWRIPLVSRLPMAEIPIPSTLEPNRKLGDLAGNPVLLNFWSTTCAACLEELDELSSARRKLDRFNLQVVPMLTEGVERADVADKFMKSFGFETLAGMADDKVAQIMQVIVNEVLGADTATPLPFSLLIDSRGDLVEIYFGKLQLQGLLRDLRLQKSLSTQSPDLGPLSFGSRLAFRDRSFTSLAAKYSDLGYDSLAKYYQQFDARFGPPRK
ncbi:MAG: ASPIC/UnbV domain-containing protein [Planctomycetes bacterium]|nr:ASPIC/UnbV domain-containing protein [Planctomycetota bacterium]